MTSTEILLMDHVLRVVDDEDSQDTDADVDQEEKVPARRKRQHSASSSGGRQKMIRGRAYQPKAKRESSAQTETSSRSVDGEKSFPTEPLHSEAESSVSHSPEASPIPVTLGKPYANRIRLLNQPSVTGNLNPRRVLAIDQNVVDSYLIHCKSVSVVCHRTDGTVMCCSFNKNN